MPPSDLTSDRTLFEGSVAEILFTQDFVDSSSSDIGGGGGGRGAGELG